MLANRPIAVERSPTGQGQEAKPWRRWANSSCGSSAGAIASTSRSNCNADRLGKLGSGSDHSVHMPSHIYIALAATTLRKWSIRVLASKHARGRKIGMGIAMPRNHIASLTRHPIATIDQLTMRP